MLIMHYNAAKKGRNTNFVGGLLSAYAQTGNYKLIQKAEEIAQLLLPAFNTPTGIPNGLINPKTGRGRTYDWTIDDSANLAEFGTLHLDFKYLSDITGNPIYREKVEIVRKVMRDIPKPNGLYFNYLNTITGKWVENDVSLGASGDSFYEYLLKAYIHSGKEGLEAKEMYVAAMKAIDKWMIRESRGGLLYVSDMKIQILDQKMGHLACFSGGMFALGSQNLPNSSAVRHLYIGKGFTNT
ncbi:hypothetical protein QYM36_006678 [Artemia franciscana]|uniref:alpha-1,2-Mannosidase n=1 Tax=Artemia franciscana TaxID=6661 RepID=A0AA88LDV2_ARTSF|nr:hypothetical protein QYM36_006678 [Artemia franciscana]